MVAVKVNDATVEMIIDTGASTDIFGQRHL